MAKVLVIGGAGYVGSAACAWLLRPGSNGAPNHAVWVLDDLSTGHGDLILPDVAGFTRARAGDAATVQELLSRERFDCVMHFAAKALVAESVAKPDLYFENNVTQTRQLLEAMVSAGVRRFIFSSTCAIFGDPGDSDIHEELPKKPINPYGETKLQAERLMEEFARERGLQAIALRYFNAAGAESGGRVGERHEPETHLIPRILQAALSGSVVEVYGTDYPTLDGTCVRDYVHVSDLASAHEAAMNRLLALPAGSSGVFEAFNLGSENGYSVRQVIEACRKATGLELPVVEKSRRPGDPARLVADSSKAQRELGFTIRHPLESILATAWTWEKKENERRSSRSGSGSGSIGRPAVFLDRDGTINEDPGYLARPEQLKLIPGVGESLARLKRAGFVLVVVSNQSGVGRGLIDSGALPKIHERMTDLLKPWSVDIDHYELCFHHPDENCACRKPKPKLIVDAAEKLGIDLSCSFMVGDKISDLGAGRNAGLKASLLVRTGEGRSQEPVLKQGEAAFVAETLREAAEWILSSTSRVS